MPLKAALIAELIAAIGTFIPGSEKVEAPRIVEIEPAVLQQKACGGSCKVIAWYGPDATIYLDRRMDPENNIMARSILLHELVHHVQFKLARHMAAGCDQWLMRERQAYEVQARWLFEYGVDARPLYMQARTLMCSPADSGRPGQASSGDTRKARQP
jgi:hypothetical protein